MKNYINNQKISIELECYLDTIFIEQKNLLKKSEYNIDQLLNQDSLNTLLLNPNPHSKHKNLIRLGNKEISNELKKFINSQGFKLFCEPDYTSGCFFYPPNYGFMGWHTNHNQIGYRMYIVKSLKGDSFFRYYENNEIITSYDPIGYSFRIFLVGDINNPYWHCVHGGSGRYSIGVHLSKI